MSVNFLQVIRLKAYGEQHFISETYYIHIILYKISFTFFINGLYCTYQTSLSFIKFQKSELLKPAEYFTGLTYIAILISVTLGRFTLFTITSL